MPFRFPTPFRRLSLSRHPSPVVVNRRRSLFDANYRSNVNNRGLIITINLKSTGFMEITPLSSLKPFKYSYRICVRICRTWRAIRYGSEDYSGLHCVMIDQQGGSIHGFLPKEQVEDMTEQPKQGQMYEIHQFSTRPHGYGLQPVKNPVIVQFNGRTIFCKVPETIPPVPTNSFRLVEFNKLDAEREAHAVPSSQAILADIYGCVRSIRPPHPQFIKRQNKLGVKCEITVENLQRETLTIVFWGKLAREFDVNAITSSPSPLLAVFCGLKITLYDQRVIANNYDHTCLFLNPPTPWTDAYKTKFSKPGDRTMVLGDFHIFETTDAKNPLSVQHLTGLDPSEYKTRSVLCEGQIRKIGANGWWYRRCSEPRCYKQCFKAEYLDNKYACKTHGLQPTIPSFRVSALIGDEVSDLSITIMGNQAEYLIGWKLEALRRKRFYINEQDIPEEISSLIGQVRVFELKGNAFAEWTVIGVGPAKENTDIASPQPDTETVSPTQIPSLQLNTPEKSCIQQKRSHPAIQHELCSDSKKNKKETKDKSTSSLVIKGKNKVD